MAAATEVVEVEVSEAIEAAEAVREVVAEVRTRVTTHEA